jgi:hypothetical protein
MPERRQKRDESDNTQEVARRCDSRAAHPTLGREADAASSAGLMRPQLHRRPVRSPCVGSGSAGTCPAEGTSVTGPAAERAGAPRPCSERQALRRSRGPVPIPAETLFRIRPRELGKTPGLTKAAASLGAGLGGGNESMRVASGTITAAIGPSHRRSGEASSRSSHRGRAARPSLPTRQAPTNMSLAAESKIARA